MKTFGRTTIYVNYTEKELLSGNEQDIKNRVLDIINTSIPIHQKNQSETLYLRGYLYGDQDIKGKVKKTRTDINNKSVENWAYAFCDWKKTFLLGKPINYSPIDDVNNEEIVKLNQYNTYEDKHWLDQEIYEDIFTCGRGFRYVCGSPMSEDDEAPYELLNCDASNTEVVYSSSINHEQLLSFIYIPKEAITIDKYGNVEKTPYDEYNVYTRNKHYVINNKNSDSLQIVDKLTTPIILNTHVIIEYYMNRQRMGFLELGKDLFDDINYIESLDMDDMEAFVNAIMVFTNAEVNKESMDAIKEYGAVSIKSTEQKKASVELLQSRMKSLDTQIFYMRKLTAIHSILSVPQANNNGDISNGETGKAYLTGQGFTSANIRVDGEEQAFKRCDREMLKVVLKICKNTANSGIKSLKVSDLLAKFSRDLTDNILVKTQALLNLATANIPPEIRNQVIGLFSDPVSVTKLQKKFEEEKRQLQMEIDKQSSNNENKINEQNNKMSKTINNQEQEQ